MRPANWYWNPGSNKTSWVTRTPTKGRRPHKVSYKESWLISCIGSYTNNMKVAPVMVSKKSYEGTDRRSVSSLLKGGFTGTVGSNKRNIKMKPQHIYNNKLIQEKTCYKVHRNP
jgi:hypothetical protein